MKINRITFGSNTQKPIENLHADNKLRLSEFAYLPKGNDAQVDSKRLKHFLGGTALLAVILTLFKIKGRKKIPDSVVELADRNLGLNKISFKRTAKELKAKILYPIKAYMEGDKGIIKKRKAFKSGLIIADLDADGVNKVFDAFYEHAQNLGIRCKRISECGSRKKEAKITWVKEAIKEAQKHFREKGEITLIDIGNLDNLTNLQINKKINSNLENRLIEISNQSYAGVVWTANTRKTRQIPMYYNNLPVVVTKLTD